MRGTHQKNTNGDPRKKKLVSEHVKPTTYCKNSHFTGRDFLYFLFPMTLEPRERRPCNVSALDEVDQKFQNSRLRDAKRKREKAKWARQVAARIPSEPTTNILSEGERNLIAYKNWGLRKKS